VPVAKPCLSTAIQNARDRQCVGIGGASRLQPDLYRQAHSIRAALPTCNTCGASGGNRNVVRRADVDVIDGIVGVVLAHLSSLPARCAPRVDLAGLTVDDRR
jgi:hypothetical protein